MNDLFCAVQSSTSSFNTDNFVMDIMRTTNIEHLKINWPEHLHTFYKTPLTFSDDIGKEISKKILYILTGKEIDSCETENLNHLNRFTHLNNLFIKINELNVSYDNIHDFKDYTLSRCQDYYLKQIINSKNNIINHWFNGIFNGINMDFDNYKNSRYFKGIEILKSYLARKTDNYDNNMERSNYINEFINIYSRWSANYLSVKFQDKMMDPIEVFKKFNKIKKINENFMGPEDCNKYNVNTTINILPCWELYLNMVYDNNSKVDEIVIDTFNDIDLTETNYRDITIKFCEKWQTKIKDLIIPNNYGNSKLFDILQKICPIIIKFSSGKNGSDSILKYFIDIYKYEQNLLGYLIIGLNVSIKKLYDNPSSLKLPSNIINILSLISLYENKDVLWNQYLKNVNLRLIHLMKKGTICNDIIKFEFDIYNYLIDHGCNSFSEKTKTFLLNIKNSVDHLSVIRKCKINYVDKNGDAKEYNNDWIVPNINKTDYIVFDKHIWDIMGMNYNYPLIDKTKYPPNIKSSLAVGKTYYDIISDTKTIDWDIENSIINYNINNSNIVSNVLQYTLVWYIVNSKFTKQELINELINKLLNDQIKCDAIKYLESYVNNLMFRDIVNICDGYLIINSELQIQQLDISTFVPLLKNAKQENNKHCNVPINRQPQIKTITMTDECLSYLRLLLLTKMFKTNSTIIYQYNNIIESLNKYIEQYIKDHKFTPELENIIKSLTSIDDKLLNRELTCLEKRDIIEKITKSQITGYIYVV